MTNVNQLIEIKNTKVLEIKDLEYRIEIIKSEMALTPCNTPESKQVFENRNQNLSVEIARYETLISDIQASIAKYDALIFGEEVKVAAPVEVEESTPVEKIVSELSAQNFTTRDAEENSVVVTGRDYDVSISVLENGYYVETWCNNVGIAHFRNYEWTNAKTVKTLKGLNGYLRKYLGCDNITL